MAMAASLPGLQTLTGVCTSRKYIWEGMRVSEMVAYSCTTCTTSNIIVPDLIASYRILSCHVLSSQWWSPLSDLLCSTFLSSLLVC
jgi:hypothetical protein